MPLSLAGADPASVGVRGPSSSPTPLVCVESTSNRAAGANRFREECFVESFCLLHFGDVESRDQIDSVEESCLTQHPEPPPKPPPISDKNGAVSNEHVGVVHYHHYRCERPIHPQESKTLSIELKKERCEHHK